jgi:hypothetical protein
MEIRETAKAEVDAAVALLVRLFAEEVFDGT